MRYRLRTLLILLAVLPPVLAAMWSYSSISLAVIGWYALIVFAVFVWMADARQNSRYRED